ncbi:MAG TPA: hypothetical protein VJ385_19100 [Fibrobacteria bacterium]|nr:hypothetical protein [Fibrobacteria bacterium]
MAPWFSISAAARAAGFASGWAVFAALLALATRPMGLGPGFSNLLPYAIAAILLSGAGHLVRHWLCQAPAPEKGETGGSLRRLRRAWLQGVRAFFHGTAACNNFVFLSAAYFLGIGITSLFLRRGRRRAPDPASSAGPAGSYWRDLNLGKREADAYYRPF